MATEITSAINELDSHYRELMKKQVDFASSTPDRSNDVANIFLHTESSNMKTQPSFTTKACRNARDELGKMFVKSTQSDMTLNNLLSRARYCAI